MMQEPTVWMQLGISEQRYPHLQREIESILKTKETIGNMMLMVRDSKLTNDEQLYAAFLISKEDIVRKLGERMPSPLRNAIKDILEE